MAKATAPTRSETSNAAVQATQPGMSEDWLAVWIGLLVFILSLGLLFGADVLGWAVSTSIWATPAKALAPVSQSYAKLPKAISLLATFGFLLIVLLLGARARANVKRFAIGVTAIFALSYPCWFLGNWAYIAATPNQRKAFGIDWSLNLTNESGYIIALLVGSGLWKFPAWCCPEIQQTPFGPSCTSRLPS